MKAQPAGAAGRALGGATLRQALRQDIPQMHALRLAVRENILRSRSVDEASYGPAIEDSGRGWVIEENGRVVAFAVANRITGNIWALFVHPRHEGRGHGRALHDTMLGWLFAQGLERATLSTQPGTRAERFYQRAGWTFKGLLPSGEAAFEFCRPDGPWRRAQGTG